MEMYACFGFFSFLICIVALLLSIRLLGKVGRLSDSLKSTEKEVSFLLRQFEFQRKRIDELRKKLNLHPAGEETGDEESKPRAVDLPESAGEPAGGLPPTESLAGPALPDEPESFAPELAGVSELEEEAARAALPPFISEESILSDEREAEPPLVEGPPDPMEETAPTPTPPPPVFPAPAVPGVSLSIPSEEGGIRTPPMISSGWSGASGLSKPFSGSPHTKPAPPQPPPSAPLAPPKEKRPGWEQRLGIALPVWIGAISLALAGGFLVKYGIEHKWLGPGVRVTLAMILGLALVAAGEWLLRKRASMTAQGATAAGISVQYAGLLAGILLYRLIPPWPGFAMIALVTAAGVFLSLRHGIIVAFLGLVGGFFSPYWIGVVAESPAYLFAYLIFLQGGLLLVTRKRQWTGLSALTLIMGLGAAFHRIFGPTTVADAPWIGLFLLLSAALFVITGRTWKEKSISAGEAMGIPPAGTLLGYGALLGVHIALAFMALRTSFSMEQWGFMGILCLGILILGRMDESYDKLPWVIFVLMTLLEAAWVQQSHAGQISSLWVVIAGVGALFGAGGFLAHGGSGRPAMWATLSSGAGLIAFGLAYWAGKVHEMNMHHWGYISLAIAVPYLYAAAGAIRAEHRSVHGETTLAAFCVAATSFVTLAVPLELDHHWITVSWAVEAAILSWLLNKLRVQALGYLGVILGLGVIARLLANPYIFDYPLGTIPGFNWILYGYGIPVAAFGIAALWYTRSGWKTTGTLFAWGGGALAFVLLTLEVRHGFHATNLLSGSPSLLEWSTYSHIWVGMGFLLLMGFQRWKAAILEKMGSAFLTVAIVKIVVFELLTSNPLWSHQDVGLWPILNRLLYVYALPCLAFGLIAGWMFRRGRSRTGEFYSWFAGLLALACTTLLVRHGFHPPDLAGLRPSIVEWSTYSTVWIAMGGLLLWAFSKWKAGIVKRLGYAFLIVSAAKITVIEAGLANPLWANQDVGLRPILNWLLFSFALPCFAFGIMAGWMVLKGEDRAGELSSWFAGFLAWICSTLLVRHSFHPPDLSGALPTIVEWATYSTVWISMGVVLLSAFSKWKARICLNLGSAFLIAAALKIIAIDLGAANPLWNQQDVGSLPILNRLLYVYALPCIAFAILAWWMFRGGNRSNGIAFSWLSGLLAFSLMTLLVRHGFHSPDLAGPSPSLVEWATYSLVWIAAGLLLLVASRRRNIRIVGEIGLALLSVSMAKIAVFDLLAVNPLWSRQDVGEWPLLNWLPYIYGLPILGYLLIRPLLEGEHRESEYLGKIGRSACLVLSFTLVSLMVRQVFHGRFLDEGDLSLMEVAGYGLSWLALSAILMLVWRRNPSQEVLWGGRILFLAAIGKILFLDVASLNPLIWHQDMGGWPVFNALLYLYALPILLLAIIKKICKDPEWRPFVGTVALNGGLFLGFVLLTLEVRQFFHPNFLDGAPILDMENYIYSAVWILFSLFLLAIGIVTRKKLPRIASLVVIFIAITKVFLYDLRELQDLYRVGSFLALGLSLLLISFLYQRYVFSEGRQ